jgi:prophage DNA circulation protein
VPPESDDNFRLLLAQDIGYIRGTIKSLDGKVDALSRKVDTLENTINGKISAIHQTIAHLVRREDCQAHMEQLERDLDGAVRTQIVAPASRDAGSFWGRIIDHGRSLATLIALLGALGGTLIALSHYISKIERTIATADTIRRREQAELKREQQEIKRIIHIWSTDAGMED